MAKNIKKPPKKAKKEKITFDKIDITTATDDDIIQSGIRYNTKKHKICYFVMFLIVLLALLPVILRTSMPRKITEKEMEIVYLKLDCYRIIKREGYELYTILNFNYRNNKIQDAKFEFTTSKVDETAEDGYVFSEVNDMNSLNSSAVNRTEEGEKVIFNINYKLDNSLLENAILKSYAYVPAAEIDYLRGQRYNCSSDTENKIELVDVVTEEKVDK